MISLDEHKHSNESQEHDFSEDEENESNNGILFDFAEIVPDDALRSVEPVPEMELIETLLNADASVRKQIIGHPLVSTFVFMKWKLVRKIFIWSFIFNVFVASLFTVYVMSVYLHNCPYQSNTSGNVTSEANKESRQCDIGLGSFSYSVTLLTLGTLLALLEIAKIWQNFSLYRREWHNLFQIFMILSLFLSVWPLRWTECKCLFSWQYATAAYGIFHVWSTLLINMGRFPKIGIYVTMYGKVLENFGYLMLSYVFLLTGFSISFCLIFPQHPPFNSIPRAILRVITMMSGEIDYVEFFYGDGKNKGQVSDDLIHPITSHILYGAFVVLVTIVLTNLLIGLAVDDIKALAQNAEFTKTTREIANISYVESIVFSSRIPYWLTKGFRKSIVIARISKQHKKDAKKTEEFSWLKLFRHSFRGGINKMCLRSRKQSVDLTDGNEPEMRISSTKSRNYGLGNGKYRFRVKFDQCHSGKFPEELYLNAIALIKKRRRTNSISFNNMNGFSTTGHVLCNYESENLDSYY